MSRGAYRYPSILGSRKAMEMVIKRFNLMAVHETEDSSVGNDAEENTSRQGKDARVEEA
jgi:hypothetical protein